MKKFKFLLITYFIIFLIGGHSFLFKINYTNNLDISNFSFRKVRNSNNLWNNLYNQLLKIENERNVTEIFNGLKNLDPKIEKLNDKNISDKKKAITLKNLLQDKFKHRKNKSSLKEILSSKKASCSGLSKIYYLLGNSMGLNVDILISFPTHFANIVNLDKGSMIVDLEDNYKSYVFNWNKAYKKKGKTWFHTWDLPLSPKYDGVQVIKGEKLKFLNLWRKGNDFFYNKKFLKAQQSYLKASKLAPNIALNYYNLGRTAGMLANMEKYSGNSNESNKLFKKAIEYYDEAIDRNPEDALAILYRGKIKSKLELTKEAVKDYKKAVKLNPSLKKFIPSYIKKKINWDD